MIKKISIIGCGAVGSGLAYNLISRLKVESLVLVDIAGDLARGVSLDLEDTRGMLGFSTEIQGGDELSTIKDSDIVVMTAGIARKDGMTRADLFKTNSAVAREVSQTIKKYAPGTIVVAVTNPLDAITYVITKETGFERNRVIGMGSSLDTARLMNILSQQVKIGTASLEGFVFGVHSNEMIVSPSRLRIKGQELCEVLSEDAIAKLRQRVKMRGGEIVGYLKNKSAHFAPALATSQLIEAIAYDKNEIIPVSILLHGEFGLNDICLGVPCLINRNGAQSIIEIDLLDSEREEIEKAKKSFQDFVT